MIEKSTSICNVALETGNHPGYSTWFVQDMLSHLINVEATIERDEPARDQGVGLSEKVLNIREKNQRRDNQDDSFWIAAARGNLAVSLMASGRFEEARGILLDLAYRPDMISNEDIYLCNICLCLLYLDDLDEALYYNHKAILSIEVSKGKHSAQMSL